MGKPTICIGENKGPDQLHSNCEADYAFDFATRIVQFLFYLNPNFQASSSFLYCTVQVGLCRTCSGTTLLVFPQGGSFKHSIEKYLLVWEPIENSERSLVCVKLLKSKLV